MHLCGRNHFLTFVVFILSSSLATAAPTTSVPPAAYEIKNQTPAPQSPLETESLQVTPAPGPEIDSFEPRLKASRVVRDHSWNIAYGLWSGSLLEKEDAFSTQVLSLTKTDFASDESAFEYGVDLTVKGQFGWHGQYKKYCCMGQWSEPYWTLGAGALYKPSELLAGIVKLGSYQVLAGGGLEDLFRQGRRWRLEGLVAYGKPGSSFLLRIGYAFDESAFSF